MVAVKTANRRARSGAKLPKEPSKLEETLWRDIRAVKLTIPVREYKFHPPRQWRFDFAWPDQMIAVECEGTGTTKDKRNGMGGHQTLAGMTKNCEKYNAAVEMGWTLYRYTIKHIKDGTAINQLERVVE